MINSRQSAILEITNHHKVKFETNLNMYDKDSFETLQSQMKMFSVFTGTNGIGKSRLLKTFRELIITDMNDKMPRYIVRQLNYGEEPDDYDPDKTDHPLVTDFILERFYECNYDNWKEKIENEINISKLCQKCQTDAIKKGFKPNYCNKCKSSIDTRKLFNFNGVLRAEQLLTKKDSNSKLLILITIKNNKVEKIEVHLDTEIIENKKDTRSAGTSRKLFLEFSVKESEEKNHLLYFKIKDLIPTDIEKLKIKIIIFHDPKNASYQINETKEKNIVNLKDNDFVKLINDSVEKNDLESVKLVSDSQLSIDSIKHDDFKKKFKIIILKKDLERVFELYYYDDKTKQPTDFLNEIIFVYDNIKDEIKEKRLYCYFEEFKKYFRRQILKKICYGNLDQLLMLNQRYKFEIHRINETIKDEKNKNRLIFPFKIEMNDYEKVKKSKTVECYRFIDESKPSEKLKFTDLSPGERLILHLILLIKEKENIKTFFYDFPKQVLLLDEPDSHCEPNLVKTFIEIIEEIIIEDINMQVIMTTHNSSTMSIVDGECLFTLSKHKDPRTHSNTIKCNLDKTKRKAYEILASSIVQTIHFFEQKNIQQIEESLKALENLIKDNSITGKFVEFAFKKRTTIMQDNTDCLQILKKITNNKSLNEGNIKPIIDYEKDFFEIEINDMNETFKDKIIYIIWPKKTNQAAWDLMIIDKTDQANKPIIYLIQVYFGGTDNDSEQNFNYKIKKTITIHNNNIKNDKNILNILNYKNIEHFQFKKYLIHGNNSEHDRIIKEQGHEINTRHFETLVQEKTYLSEYKSVKNPKVKQMCPYCNKSYIQVSSHLPKCSEIATSIASETI